MNAPQREARRWLHQALDDLRFVRWVLDEGVFFDKGCFLAQQAGEKALKACLYAAGRRRVFGHSLMELIDDLQAESPLFAPVLDQARRLDRYYITTRYPNGLPGGSPYQAFTIGDLRQATEDVGEIIDAAQVFLGPLLGTGTRKKPTA